MVELSLVDLVVGALGCLVLGMLIGEWFAADRMNNAINALRNIKVIDDKIKRKR